VLVAAPLDADLARALDGLPGLTRVSSPGGDGLWRLTADTGRARLLGPDAHTLAVLDSHGSRVRDTISPGPAGRVVVLAERHDPGWRATLDGVALAPTTHAGWAQAFRLPPEGGTLVVTHRDSERARWLQVQGGLLAAVIVLALPGMRRHDEETP
jgi:hypothetical protein